jgi:hypothetical protein
MSKDSSASQSECLRIRFGFWIVTLGLVLVVVVFLAAMARWTAASDVAAAVGSVTGVIGTIIGAFFGVQVGSAGKEKAETARAEAERKALRLAAAMPPDVASKVLAEDE